MRADPQIVRGRIGARQGRHFVGRHQRIFTVQQREKEIAEKEEAGVLLQPQRTGRDDETDEVKKGSLLHLFMFDFLLSRQLYYIFIFSLTIYPYYIFICMD